MMLSFPYLVVYISSIFWISPAIRNYKTRLFLYFFVLAISDPIILASIFLHILPSSRRLYVLLSWLTIASLRNMFSSKTLYVKILALFFLIGAAATFSPVSIVDFVIIMEHICVTFIFVTLLLSYVAQNSKVKVFHIVLLLYEISIVLKDLFVILNIELGISHFFATSIFQMLIAVFFSVYKETDDKLLIDMKNV